MKYSVFNLDEQLFLILNNAHFDFLDSIMLIVNNINLLIAVIFFVMFIAIQGKNKESYHPVTTFLVYALCLIFLSSICFLVLPNLFSMLIHRISPCLNPNISDLVRLVNNDCNPDRNFYSLRTCVIFSITSFLFFTVKEKFLPVKVFLISLSLLVAYSRIYLGVHYPSDVLTAGITGISLGFFFSKFYFYLTQKVLIV